MLRVPRELAFLVFLITFALACFIFVVVQVLQSYPFGHLGFYGDQQLLGLTYTQTFEVAAPVCVVAFAAWQFGRFPGGSPKSRMARAMGRTMLVFGALVAAVVYVETLLLWGEIWFGVHAFPGLPGGGGYPWGGEQVSYNLCLSRAPGYSVQTPNCYFLNYNEVLAVAVLSLIVGGIMAAYLRQSSPEDA